jgi:hypothetical protein
MVEKPKPTSSLAEKELNKVEKQLEEFDDQVKSLTLDRMNCAPKLEKDRDSARSQQEISNSKTIYLKPVRSISSREKFNENYREEYEKVKKYVEFEAKHNEIKGEKLELWTKPFAGMPAEFWNVPVGVSVSAPQYVKNRIDECYYHKLSMQQNVSNGTDGMGEYYGSMVVDNVVQRLETLNIKKNPRIYMGSRNFS